MWHLVQSVCPFENQNPVQWIACGLEWHPEVRMGEVRLLSVAPGFVHYAKLIERVVVQTVENERGICASVESQLAVERKRSTTLRQENVQQSGTVRHLQEALANLNWYMGQMLPYQPTGSLRIRPMGHQQYPRSSPARAVWRSNLPVPGGVQLWGSAPGRPTIMPYGGSAGSRRGKRGGRGRQTLDNSPPPPPVRSAVRLPAASAGSWRRTEFPATAKGKA